MPEAGTRGSDPADAAPDHPANCPVCSAPTEGTTFERYRVCGSCRYHFQLSATERIDLLADPESFKASNPSLVSVDPLVFTDRVSYRDRLERARSEKGDRAPDAVSGRLAVVALFFSAALCAAEESLTVPTRTALLD